MSCFTFSFCICSSLHLNTVFFTVNLHSAFHQLILCLFMLFYHTLTHGRHNYNVKPLLRCLTVQLFFLNFVDWQACCPHSFTNAREITNSCRNYAYVHTLYRIHSVICILLVCCTHLPVFLCVSGGAPGGVLMSWSNQPIRPLRQNSAVIG